jgi:hypothetical protein
MYQKGHATIQADRCCLVTTEAWVQSWVTSCDIHEGQNVTGESFFPIPFGFHLVIIILTLFHYQLSLPSEL